MKLEIKQGDLFEINKGNINPYALAHCISSDFGMGAGIVVVFNKLYQMKDVLLCRYNGNLSSEWKRRGYVLPEKVDGVYNDTTKIVFNLVTKQFVYQKPSYETLYQSLQAAKEEMLEAGYIRLAMPLIGCGIDGLVWSKVKNVIQDVFADTDFEVQIRYLEKDSKLLEL